MDESVTRGRLCVRVCMCVCVCTVLACALARFLRPFASAQISINNTFVLFTQQQISHYVEPTDLNSFIKL